MRLAIFVICGSLFLCSSTFAQTMVSTVVDLEQAVAAASEGETIVLSPVFPTTLVATVNLNVAHENNFSIDGAGITLLPASNSRHFNINKTSANGGLTLKNFTFKGFRNTANINDESAGTQGGGLAINGQGTVIVENTRFDAISGNNSGAAVWVASTSKLHVLTSSFVDNYAGGHGGAILSQGSLWVSDSTFTGNISKAGGYSGGAIALFKTTVAGETHVVRSKFMQNVSYTRGGAIAAHQAQQPITIEESYFEGNQTKGSPSGYLDGGAVSIYGPDAVVFTLKNSTFYKNEAADDAGAVFIENWHADSHSLMVNNTFFQNSSKDVNPAASSGFNVATSGGAIQLSLPSKVRLENNTIAQNYTSSTYQRGAGIGFHANSDGAPIVDLKNNIILGNYYGTAIGGSQTSNLHANFGGKVIVTRVALTNSGGNIGLDNGTALPAGVDMAAVFGNVSPVLWTNYSPLKAGNPSDGSQQIVPSLSILPNDGVVLGLADGTGVATSLTLDGRNLPVIAGNPDIGAVEILWVKFDPNGGSWNNLPAPIDLAYEGVFYASAVGAYYDIGFIGSGALKAVTPSLSLPTALGVNAAVDLLAPASSGLVFTGWNTQANGQGTPYIVGAVLPATANLTLYAQWAPAITYQGMYSRRTHGSSGIFDLRIDESKLVTERTLTIEPRNPVGGVQTLVLKFDAVPAAVGNVVVKNTVGTVMGGVTTSLSVAGNYLVITLTGIADITRADITVGNAGGTGQSIHGAVGFLIGDVSQNGRVQAGDSSLIAELVGVTSLNASNYLRDISCNGRIQTADRTYVDDRVGNIL